MKKLFLIIVLIVVAQAPLYAAYSGLNAVKVSADVSESPLQIRIYWPEVSQFGSYAVFRRFSPEESWGAAVAYLSNNATEYIDTDVQIGVIYEYKIFRDASEDRFRGDGYIVAGIKIPLVENRGTLLLLTDRTVSGQLTTELDRFTEDCIGDGWSVIRHDVERGVPGQPDGADAVKALILSEYQKRPSELKAVLLFGHVPVPYSGDIYPDGHSDHRGAWPTDTYYADMDGVWTDETVNSTSGDYNGWNIAYNNHNDNVPGDGKFDQSIIPSSNGVELMISRVDLWGFEQSQWTSNTKSEVELLRQYLDKNHNFRHKLFDLQRRGIISDHFEDWGIASDGWVPFSTFFGAENVFNKTDQWLDTLSRESYLCGYACGGGNPYGMVGIGLNNQNCGTKLLIESDQKVVFTMMCGSYFGDWDLPANFLRAPLATTTYTLTCSWAGLPRWVHHHMALGYSIGYCTRLSQNNRLAEPWGYYFYYPEPEGIHAGLMGDPTLRLHTVLPVTGLSASQDGDSVYIDWQESTDTVLGYHVYFSEHEDGPYARKSNDLITQANFRDGSPREGMNYYMVRAIKLETSASGSYYNPSQGVFCAANFEGDDDPDAPALSFFSLAILLCLFMFFFRSQKSPDVQEHSV